MCVKGVCVREFSSDQCLDRIGRRGNTKDDSAESFLMVQQNDSTSSSLCCTREEVSEFVAFYSLSSAQGRLRTNVIKYIIKVHACVNM